MPLLFCCFGHGISFFIFAPFLGALNGAHELLEGRTDSYIHVLGIVCTIRARQAPERKEKNSAVSFVLNHIVSLAFAVAGASHPAATASHLWQ
jgi:hypothetical protein